MIIMSVNNFGDPQGALHQETNGNKRVIQRTRALLRLAEGTELVLRVWRSFVFFYVRG